MKRLGEHLKKLMLCTNIQKYLNNIVNIAKKN